MKLARQTMALFIKMEMDKVKVEEAAEKTSCRRGKSKREYIERNSDEGY